MAQVTQLTQFERLAFQTITALMDTVSGLAASHAAILQSLSLRLPNLSDEDRLDLKRQSELHSKNAQNLKENADQLRSIVQRPQKLFA